MANLLAAGISVIATLGVSATVSINVKFLDALAQINQKIVTGAPLSTLFSNEAMLPIAEPQLMAVHKCTSNMDEMLASIARYYEEEFTAVVDGLSPIIEPLMIVFVGLMIGVMMLMLYSSIFSAGETINWTPRQTGKQTEWVAAPPLYKTSKNCCNLQYEQRPENRQFSPNG
jgi:type IV pilus assembly protein PilC